MFEGSVRYHPDLVLVQYKRVQRVAGDDVHEKIAFEGGNFVLM